MPDSLTATSAVLTGVRPKLDYEGSILELMIDIALSYVDANGVPAAGRTVTFDAWQVLNSTQKENMQDIQNAIQSYIVANYFA